MREIRILWIEDKREIGSSKKDRIQAFSVNQRVSQSAQVFIILRRGSLLLDNPSDAVPNGTRVRWQVHADTTQTHSVAVQQP